MTTHVDPFDAWQRPYEVNYRSRDSSPAAYEDEPTLRRGRRHVPAGSVAFRRAADHPVEPWADELAVALSQRAVR